VPGKTRAGDMLASAFHHALRAATDGPPARSKTACRQHEPPMPLVCQAHPGALPGASHCALAGIAGSADPAQAI